MSNPIFYAADMSAATFTMSLAENSSFPLTNLHSNLPSMLWKSSANTNGQWLKIDLGFPKPVNFLGFGTYNFYSMTTVKFQYATTDDGNFTDPVDAIADLNDPDNAPNADTFTLVTKRYLRIYFTNTGGIIPQIGLLYIGLKMEMPYNYDMDAELGNKQFNTSAVRAISGIMRTTAQIGGWKRMEVSFTLNTDAVVMAFQTMMDAIKGKLNPFFFKDHLDVINIVHFEEDYIPARGIRYNINEIIRLKMCNQSVG
jgi:hypothetical protein